MGNLSNALRTSGVLFEAEAAACYAVVITRSQKDRFWEAVNMDWLGFTLAVRGMNHESVSALQRSLRMFVVQAHNQYEGWTNFELAQQALWVGAFVDARVFANRSWELAHVLNYERDVIRATHVQGAAALGLHDFATADERLHHALTRARQVNLVDEELPALIALAELRRREGKHDEAREFLDDVWGSAEGGPYPLFHADACNVLAQLERDAGDTKAAIEAATKAYRLAWCDGPPYAYHWGLVAAQKHLAELGAPVPDLPPFDPARYEPMPEVEIDPEDEFHAG
ncbi:MAG TPA: tetratricopeptide repeat protein [Blastocatellia bacterium]|nr:tetratricopeptide repeat protein [Blastocatellia bacterium]